MHGGDHTRMNTFINTVLTESLRAFCWIRKLNAFWFLRRTEKKRKENIRK